jgi:DNA-binding protein HU-beta
MVQSKDDIIKAVSKNLNIKQPEVKLMIETVFKTIAESLIAGNDVFLVGIMKFTIKEREARKGRNPSSGEVIDIAASKVVKIKPGLLFNLPK